MISYQFFHISDEKFAEIVRLSQERAPTYAEGWKRWKQHNHHAGYRADRAAGLHYAFLRSVSENGEEKLHCPCGLAINPEPSADEVMDGDVGIPLQAIQRAKGHLKIPVGEGVSVAILMSAGFDWALGARRLTAICQSCFAKVVKVEYRVARDFVDMHNESCA